jgi:hypothetical protein
MDELLTTDACTLPTVERPLRLAEFDALFAETVTDVERHGSTVRLQMAGPPSLGERVRDLTERESSCCSFFTFTVDGAAESLTLEISVPPERKTILGALADRALELSS